MRSSRSILFAQLGGGLVLTFLVASGGSAFARSDAQVSDATQPGSGKGSLPWSEPARELAAKVASVTGCDAAIVLAVKNISSLGSDQAAEVRRALRSELRRQGLRLVRPARAAITDAARGDGGRTSEPARVVVTLSENTEGYLWVAEIRRSSAPGTPEVTMIEVGHPSLAEAGRPSASLAIRKTLVWEQDVPILDATVVELSDKSGLLVLDPSKVSLHAAQGADDARRQAGASSESPGLEQSVPLPHTGPWPRDVRGRLVVRSDQSLDARPAALDARIAALDARAGAASGAPTSFDVYAPGIKCRGTLQPALALDCREGDEPWPLDVKQERSGEGLVRASIARGRNFFDGRLIASGGEERHVPPFFSGAALQVNGSTLWILAGVDGRLRVLNGTYDSLATFDGWGSDLTSVRSGCGSGWLALADGALESSEPDAVRAYEVGRRGARAVSPAAEFPGPITALWPAADGASALAVSRNLETGRYEAYRLSISCGQ